MISGLSILHNFCKLKNTHAESAKGQETKMWTAGKPSLHTRLRDSVVASPQSDRPTSYWPENAEEATHFRYLSNLYQWIGTSET